MLLKKLIFSVLMVTLLVGCANMSESQRSTATGTAAELVEIAAALADRGRA